MLVVLLAGCQAEPEYPVIEADFEVATEFPRIFNHIEFDNLPDGAMSYHWDFGNGETSDEKFPQLVVFEEAKTYSVSLTTTSLGAIKNTVTKEVQIGAYFIKNLTIKPEAALKEVVQGNGKVRLIILQRKNTEHEPVFETMAFELGEDLNQPITIPVTNVGFGGWPNSYQLYPIFRLVDDSTGDILVDTEYTNYGKFQFNPEENLGTSIIHSNIRNPSGFEIEFYYDYGKE